jgi:hypothetical protein
MEEVMRKMSQITTASSKISILALLFIVTAAPHIRDYGGTKLHQKNLESEKGVASGNLDHFPVAPKTNKLGQASRKSSDAVVPTTESLRQAQRNTHDGVAPTASEQRGQQLLGDGTVRFLKGEGGTATGDPLPHTDSYLAGSKTSEAAHPVKGNGNIGYEPAGQVYLGTNNPNLHTNQNLPANSKDMGGHNITVDSSDTLHAIDGIDKAGLISPADGTDPGTKTPTFLHTELDGQLDDTETNNGSFQINDDTHNK